MTFEELGAALRAEREKRRLGIEDVANQLKISPRLLRALEDGNVDALPHPAYARGFIRSYAGWLGLSSDEIQAAMDNSRPAPSKKPADAADIFIPEPEPSSGKRRGGGIFVFILLCMVAGGVYYAWQAGALDAIEAALRDRPERGGLQSADTYMAAKDEQRAQANEPPPPPQNSDEQRDNRAERLLPLPGNQNNTVLAPIPSENQSRPIDRVTASPVNEADKAAAQSEPKAKEVKEDGEARPGEIPGQHKLVITATEECWVHSSADKTDTRQFSLRKGDTFALTFAKSLELKLGNAGGVRLRYDGKDLPPAGTSGQVKNLSFPPDPAQ